jgi:TATA-box binding protein (TBP) (component of TFIID and TFIIIB)
MNEINEPYNYHVSNTETVLINSDLSVNFNINLKKLSKILKKKGLFNTYEPDEHSGINLKYYYNIANLVQGFCNCQPHCATKEKHPVCTKITILIFRPGSIIITGSRNIEQLKSAHELIVKLMEENMNSVKVEDAIDDNKHIALLNNEFRKISRKPRLFYIKRENIITN